MMDTILLINLSEKLQEIYNFNGYDIEKEKIVKIAYLMKEIDSKKTKEEMMKFLDMVNKGVYGMLYRAPTCILSMYQKYVKDTRDMMP
ncbi:MAG: hypothetical protein GX158_12075 [Bacteroidales bacterium]|nr:hypothetical protein [Bacteroidales bacterium]